MPVFYDQLNRPVNLPSTPKRIISIVPSQTELLFYLGLNEEVIGITKFCIYPEDKFKVKIKIGGTKQLNIQLIKSLQPDLIIANKEENEREQIEELSKYFPVWISDINNLQSAVDMIEKVGELVSREKESINLISTIRDKFEAIGNINSFLRVVYLIWRKPYMAAGNNTFIDDMLGYCGLKNAVTVQRYPELSPDDLTNLNPDVVLLSSEPYPFTEKHITEIQTMIPNAKIMLVDGEMFSWYGSRLLHAPAYFKQLKTMLI